MLSRRRNKLSHARWMTTVIIWTPTLFAKMLRRRKELSSKKAGRGSASTNHCFPSSQKSGSAHSCSLWSCASVMWLVSVEEELPSHWQCTSSTWAPNQQSPSQVSRSWSRLWLDSSTTSTKDTQRSPTALALTTTWPTWWCPWRWWEVWSEPFSTSCFQKCISL